MFRKISTNLFVPAVVLFLSLFTGGIATASGEPERQTEIGGPTPLEYGDPKLRDILPLDDLEAELDMGLSYLMLTGEGIDDLYSGMPQIGVGVSFLVAPHIRNFYRIEYGQVSGDPFRNIPGFDSPDDTTLRSVATTLGLRFNMSQNRKLRFEMSIGVQSAWQQEETIGILSNGDIGIQKASGFNFGMVGTFGPTLVLGKNKNLLGLEFGFGGSKGEVHGDGYSHDIDLTGVSTRIYYALGL